VFDSIGYCIQNRYKDVGLANGVEYCYKIQSKGAYSGTGFIDPILNFSQEVCSSAIDTEPPCPPRTMVNADCDSLKNEISWDFPAFDSCYSDVVLIRIYYSTTSTGDMQVLSEFPIGSQSSYVHILENSVAGCYAVAAIDSFQNESILVRACVDNCPVYELPNTFSPNLDGVNDTFKPFPYAFIASVQFDVFNRWGNKLFSSSNPAILWDGNDASSGNKLPDGVYFYVCDVEEIRLDNNVTRTLKGTITLFGNSSKNGN
jgi:gliding motility-associated-like protein